MPELEANVGSKPHSAVVTESEPILRQLPSNNTGATEHRTGDLDAMARVAGELGNSLAQVLLAALRDLHEREARQTNGLRDSVQQQQERLEAAIEGLMEMKGKVERLTELVSEHKSVGFAAQEKCEQLSAGVASLQEAGARHESELTALREQTQELSVSTANRVDTCLNRLDVQQEELSAVKSTVSSEVSARVAALVERLDRQAAAIRSLWEAHSQQQAALEQIGEGLLRLKASSVSANAVEASL